MQISKEEQEAIKRGSEQYAKDHGFLYTYLKNRKLRVPSVKKNR
jgi:hypothetical protein